MYIIAKAIASYIYRYTNTYIKFSLLTFSCTKCKVFIKSLKIVGTKEYYPA